MWLNILHYLIIFFQAGRKPKQPKEVDGIVPSKFNLGVWVNVVAVLESCMDAESILAYPQRLISIEDVRMLNKQAINSPQDFIGIYTFYI